MATRRNIRVRKTKKYRKNYKRTRRGGEDPTLEPLRFEPRPAMSTEEEFKDARWVMTHEKIKRDEEERNAKEDKKNQFMSESKSPFNKGGKTKKKKRKYRK